MGGESRQDVTALLSRVATDDVRAYCRDHELEEALPRALAIVRDCLPRGRDLGLRIEVDPQVGDDWIAVDLRIPGTVEEFTQAYNEHTKRITEALLPESWLRICLARTMA